MSMREKKCLAPRGGDKETGGLKRNSRSLSSISLGNGWARLVQHTASIFHLGELCSEEVSVFVWWVHLLANRVMCWI